jgi:hypothetical protein
MKKLISVCLIGCATFTSAQAKDSDNACGNFHLQISNLTNVACVLTSQVVIHGNLITPPPSSILPNDSKRFDMSQTVYGPAITLSYQCGAENISFTSQQNFCVLEAGDITGTILHPFPANINASSTALPGSYLWEKSGSINWTILTI